MKTYSLDNFDREQAIKNLQEYDALIGSRKVDYSVYDTDDLLQDLDDADLDYPMKD